MNKSVVRFSYPGGQIVVDCLPIFLLYFLTSQIPGGGGELEPPQPPTNDSSESKVMSRDRLCTTPLQNCLRYLIDCLNRISRRFAKFGTIFSKNFDIM